MQPFQSILLVTDGTARSQAALEQAAVLASSTEARLIVVEALDEMPRDLRMLIPEMPPTDLQEILVRQGSRHLQQLVTFVRQEGVQVEAKVLIGTPFLEIIREVLRHRHDLVMILAGQEKGLKELFFGSTTMHLMRKCPCPVWVIKPQRSRYARILAALDLDPHDEVKNALNAKIMELAVWLAQGDGSELHLVHTWTLYAEAILKGYHLRNPKSDIHQLIHQNREQHRQWLNQFVEQYPLESLKHKVHLVKGDAGIVIPRLAKKHHMDLIVMGTQCHTGVAGYFIGNTAEQILRSVGCAVLTVKPDGFVSPVTLKK